MKRLITFAFSLVFVGAVFAQDGFNFKGLVTDANGNPLSNTSIDVRATIREGTTTVWDEVHSNVQTDQYGIFSIIMGEGTRNGGTATNFNDIDWNNPDMKYLIQVDAGNGFQTLVMNELFKYVPYAKVANKVNGVQDKISVGLDDGRKLYVEGDAYSWELVRFKLTNASSSEDVLDLEIDQAPSSGLAQFIECNVGAITYFKVDSNGDIFTMGEIHGFDSNDADMKAYIYGNVAANGSIVGYASTTGFTVTKTGTGVYEVYFTNSPGDAHVYIVVASLVGGTGAAFLNSYQYADHFTIYTFDASGSAADHPFNFVVYKK